MSVFGDAVLGLLAQYKQTSSKKIKRYIYRSTTLIMLLKLMATHKQNIILDLRPIIQSAETNMIIIAKQKFS